MSKRGKYIAMLLFMALIGFSCEEKQATPPVVYPNNSIVATVAGTTYVYTPQSVKFSGDTLSIYATYVVGQGNGCSGGTYSLGIEGIYAKNTGIYLLGKQEYAFTAEWGFCSLNSFSYYTDSVNTGTINIAKFDTINHTITGTFSFTAEMQHPMRNGGTEAVTSGRLINVTW